MDKNAGKPVAPNNGKKKRPNGTVKSPKPRRRASSVSCIADFSKNKPQQQPITGFIKTGKRKRDTEKSGHSPDSKGMKKMDASGSGEELNHSLVTTDEEVTNEGNSTLQVVVQVTGVGVPKENADSDHGVSDRSAKVIHSSFGTAHIKPVQDEDPSTSVEDSSTSTPIAISPSTANSNKEGN